MATLSALAPWLSAWLLAAIAAGLSWGAFVHAGRGGADDTDAADGADRSGTQAAGGHLAGMTAPSPGAPVCVSQIRCGRDTA